MSEKLQITERTFAVSAILAAVVSKADHNTRCTAALSIVCSSMAYEKVGDYDEHEQTAHHLERSKCFTEMIDAGYAAMNDVLQKHLAAARNQN